MGICSHSLCTRNCAEWLVAWRPPIRPVLPTNLTLTIGIGLVVVSLEESPMRFYILCKTSNAVGIVKNPVVSRFILWYRGYHIGLTCIKNHCSSAYQNFDLIVHCFVRLVQDCSLSLFHLDIFA